MIEESKPFASTDSTKSANYAPAIIPVLRILTFIRPFCLQVNFQIHTFGFFHKPPYQAVGGKFQFSQKHFTYAFFESHARRNLLVAAH